MNIVNLESLLLHLFYVVYGIKAKLKVVSIQAMRYMPSTPSSFLKLAIGSSAAIVGVTYISSRYEASKCLSCILENPKMNTELFNVTRDLIMLHDKKYGRLMLQEASEKRNIE